MQKWILIALGLGMVIAQGDGQTAQDTAQQDTTQQDAPQQDTSSTTNDDTTQDDSQASNTTDTSTNSTSSAPPSDDELAEFIANAFDEFADLTPEEKEKLLADFRESDDIAISEFGFTSGAPNCTMTVPDNSQNCPNYEGLPVTAADDDFSAIITLIENTCASDSTTAPNSLGPFLCLGAVGSCHASELGWDLPQGNNKSNIETFFNTVDFSKMTEFGNDNDRTTLCKKDCESAWKFWTECEAFELDKERDPCSGLPEEGCYDPSNTGTITVDGASSASTLTFSVITLFGIILACF